MLAWLQALDRVFGKHICEKCPIRCLRWDFPVNILQWDAPTVPNLQKMVVATTIDQSRGQLRR